MSSSIHRHGVPRFGARGDTSRRMVAMGNLIAQRTVHIDT